MVARGAGGKGMQKEACILLATDRCVSSETTIASITHQFIPLLGLRPRLAAVAGVDVGTRIQATSTIAAGDQQRAVGELDDLRLIAIYASGLGDLPRLPLIVRVSQDVISASTPSLLRTDSCDEDDAARGGNDPVARSKEASILEAVTIDRLRDIGHGLPCATTVGALSKVHLDRERRMRRIVPKASATDHHHVDRMSVSSHSCVAVAMLCRTASHRDRCTPRLTIIYRALDLHVDITGQVIAILLAAVNACHERTIGETDDTGDTIVQ